jgi:hypothetical protein
MPPDVPGRKVKNVYLVHPSVRSRGEGMRILYQVCVLFWYTLIKIIRHQPQRLIPGSFLKPEKNRLWRNKHESILFTPEP